MSCSIDLKEYFLGEGSREDRRQAETHLAACDSCRDELSRLQLTGATLAALRDEEMPRRIAFVSDKIFEPRWYQRLWNSGPRLGFIAASMLACAILVHAFARPSAAPAPAVASIDTRQIEERIAREVDARLAETVNTAVTRAVAASESRQQQKTIEMLQAAGKRYEEDRRFDLAAYSEQLRMLQKQRNRDYAMSQGLQ